MFTIIGGDGKEYGPATAEQIRSWIAAGRANLDTRAKALGSDDWRYLRDFPEFSPSAPAATAEPPPLPLPAVDLAERETRLFARMVDWCVSVLFSLPGGLILGQATMSALIQMVASGEFDPTAFQTTRAAAGGFVLLAGMVVLFLIQVILLSVRGQTLGKMAMGIRIVREVDGTSAGFVRAWLLREFVPELLGLIPVIGLLMLKPLFWLVDCCFIFRADRRCIHDFIAGTIVVKVTRQN